MRKSAALTAVTALLGGCAGSFPPQPEMPREPIAVEAPAPPEASTPPAADPPPAPRRPREIRVDGTSIESFRASWDLLRASLSPAQQTELNDAVIRLTFDPYGGATNLPMNLRNSPIVPEMIRDRIDGLTYAEIVALAP